MVAFLTVHKMTKRQPAKKATGGEISSDLYHALQCDIEISKVKSFELEKK